MTREQVIAEIAKAMKDDLAVQMKATYLPQPAHPADTWTAEGGVIDLEQLALAVLTRLEQLGLAPIPVKE